MFSFSFTSRKFFSRMQQLKKKKKQEDTKMFPSRDIFFFFFFFLVLASINKPETSSFLSNLVLAKMEGAPMLSNETDLEWFWVSAGRPVPIHWKRLDCDTVHKNSTTKYLSTLDWSEFKYLGRNQMNCKHQMITFPLKNLTNVIPALFSNRKLLGGDDQCY